MLVGALAGVFIVEWGLDPYLGVLLCLIMGVLIGGWQAFWIAYAGIPPFIVTLAGMLTFRGLGLMILNGQTISKFPDKYKSLFNDSIPYSWLSESNPDIVRNVSIGLAIAVTVFLVAFAVVSRAKKTAKGYAADNIGVTIARPLVVGAVVIFAFSRLGQYRGIPMVLVLLAVIILIYSYFTQNTIYGRYLYAMGGNEKAARLSGINTKRMMFFAYTNMGFLASVAAMVCVARFDSASTQAGTNYELDAIASCFIGGASAYGGVGKVSGAVIGAIFIGVLNMGMSLTGGILANSSFQRVVKGLVLLAAVIFDLMSKKRKQTA
jgi:putative multiple sugar transport system permease protein